MKKNGVTLIELFIVIAILGVISIAVYNLFNVFVKQTIGIQEQIITEQKFDIGFHTLLNDFMSMSIVMTEMRDVVPNKIVNTDGSLYKGPTNQTLKLEDSVTYDGNTISFTTADGTFLESTTGGTILPELKQEIVDKLFFNSDSEIPQNGITFSIGIDDADYEAGRDGTDTDIRDLYFLEYRDDDGDGRITYDGSPEDNDRDGIDFDGDGMDGEDPDVVDAVVGYEVTYFLVPQAEWFQKAGKRFKWFYLMRKFNQPHMAKKFPSTYEPRYTVVADKVALFSIIPFKWVRGEKIFLPPDSLYAIRNADGTIDYNATTDFNISFEIVLVTVTQTGKRSVFRRVVTPAVTYNAN